MYRHILPFYGNISDTAALMSKVMRSEMFSYDEFLLRIANVRERKPWGDLSSSKSSLQFTYGLWQGM